MLSLIREDCGGGSELENCATSRRDKPPANPSTFSRPQKHRNMLHAGPKNIYLFHNSKRPPIRVHSQTQFGIPGTFYWGTRRLDSTADFNYFVCVLNFFVCYLCVGWLISFSSRKLANKQMSEEHKAHTLYERVNNGAAVEHSRWV